MGKRVSALWRELVAREDLPDRCAFEGVRGSGVLEAVALGALEGPGEVGSESAMGETSMVMDVLVDHWSFLVGVGGFDLVRVT